MALKLYATDINDQHTYIYTLEFTNGQLSHALVM